MNWNGASTFLVGLLLGAGGVWIFVSIQQTQGNLSPLQGMSNYFKGIPAINTQTPVKG